MTIALLYYGFPNARSEKRSKERPPLGGQDANDEGEDIFHRSQFNEMCVRSIVLNENTLEPRAVPPAEVRAILD